MLTDNIERKLEPESIKLFFTLNLTEHEIYPCHNVKIPKIVGIFTFIGRINTPIDLFSRRTYTRKILVCDLIARRLLQPYESDVIYPILNERSSCCRYI